jgi:uncharacterized protein
MSLIETVIKNNSKKIIELLSSGVNLNAAAEDAANITPLHFAAQYDSLEAAQVLILAGANVCSQTDDEYTPLDTAKLHKSNKVKDLLIKFHERKI